MKLNKSENDLIPFSTLFRSQLLAGAKSEILCLQPGQTARRIYSIPILFTNQERHISKQVQIHKLLHSLYVGLLQITMFI